MAIAYRGGREKYEYGLENHPFKPGSQMLVKNFGHEGAVPVPIGDVIKVIPGKAKAVFDAAAKSNKKLGYDVKRGAESIYVINPYNQKQQEIVASALGKLRKK